MKYCMVQTGDIGDVCETQFSTAAGNGLHRQRRGRRLQERCRTSTRRSRPSSLGNALAIQVRLQNTAVAGFPECQLNGFRDTCRFFLTGNGFAGDSVRPTAEEILDAPIQRSFMGDIERTEPRRSGSG